MDITTPTLLTSPEAQGAVKPTGQSEVPGPGLPVSSTSFGVQISAEAQYLFEMDKYLSGLESTERSMALAYLSSSNDPLLKAVPEYYQKSQVLLGETLGQDRAILLDRTGSEYNRALLDTGFELNGDTEIGVVPLAAKIFRLDGNDSFYPVRLNRQNDAVHAQLDELEKKVSGILGNQDTANLIGSVRNALSASENVFLSLDDVLHYNYSIEQARTAVATIDVPENIRSELSSLVEQGIDYQNNKQSQFLRDVAGQVGSGRGSTIASEDVRLGTAAQLFNNQFHSQLSATGSSLLASRGLVDQLLTEHVDLIRFSPDKLDAAFAFYKSDFEVFTKALNKDFSGPQELNPLDLGGDTLGVGRNAAMEAIRLVGEYLQGR